MTIRPSALVLVLFLTAGCHQAGDEIGVDGLTVKPAGSMAGYSRDRFPHWIPVQGNCNTRETVLERDGTDVTKGPDCAPTSGSWYSPYDGATWTNASDLDIDHTVPLAEAWRSGARSWTTGKRRDFANDLTRPQLIAVTNRVNRAKGDKTPAAWKPPLAAYHCEYARRWITVKTYWELSVTEAERDALADMLKTCR